MFVKYQIQTEFRYPPNAFGNISHGEIAVEEFQDFDDNVANLVLENRLDAAIRLAGHALFQDRNENSTSTSRHFSESALLEWLDKENSLETRIKVSGYFQNRKYLEYLQCRDILLELSPRKLSANAINLARELGSEESLAVHIRRGDYLQQSGEGALSVDYYLSSLRELGANPASKIFVFTDSRQYVEDEFRRRSSHFDLVLDCNEELSPAETIFVMSRATKFVASKSTFSWWAASTGNTEKEVIFPSGWNPHLVPDKWKLGSTEGYSLR